MSLVSQIVTVTATNLRNIPLRLGSSLVIVIGIAGVVAVLIPVLAMALGFRATLESDGRADRVIVLAEGVESEYEGNISRENVEGVLNAPGVRRDASGEPIASAEVVLVAPVSRKSDNSDVNVTFRGVGEQYFTLRPELKVVSGRMFRRGTQELLVGASAAAQFAGLEIGSQVRLQEGDWTVVGIFAGGNGSRESEVIADAQTVMSAYKMNAVNSIIVALESPESFEMFRQVLESDRRLLVDALREPEYLATASKDVNRRLKLVAYVIGSIMALGALFGAINSMHSAVVSRGVEIATLRAIGFGSLPVAVAVLLEALLLAFVGAAIGVGIAYVAFDGARISTLGGALFDSQLVYSLTITPPLVVGVIALACSLGLAGALFPALRAARVNIAEALHET